jgi:hypothetical protein
LTETLSKSRERAESAFGKTQSQFMARSRILSEDDAIVQARDEKTLRLRELRMAKEASRDRPSPAQEASILQLAKQDLANRLGVPLDDISVAAAKSAIWPDSSLGHPVSGFVYSQIVTPGYDILLRATGRTYVYHSDAGARVVYCGQA